MATPREGFGEIKREHVDQACEEALKEGVGPRGGSYFVRYRGAELPAKRILRDAFRIATGSEISASAFSGGTFTARILEGLGVEVVVRPSEPATS